jgi:mannose-6-phosphate isomerase-like protein (cupin superfamily)
VIVHLKPGELELPRVVDPRYVGDSVSKYHVFYESADGLLQLGFWDFQGVHATPVHDGYEEVLVVLTGTLTVECDGVARNVGPGEVLVYDCPIPSQRLSSPGGITAAYVMRHRTPPGRPAP